MGLFRRKQANLFDGHDPNNQLRPRISRAEFFRREGAALCWVLLEPLSDEGGRLRRELGEPEGEVELARRLSAPQKALYFWWYLDAQVTNGGFTQFFYNGYERYVPSIIEGLNAIGERQIAKLVSKADAIYAKRKKKVERARAKGVLDQDLYDELDGLGPLDDAYFDSHDNIFRTIERLARSRPDDFCVDEDGVPIDPRASGTFTTQHSNGERHEVFTLSDGQVQGVLRVYYDNGQIESEEEFDEGTPTGAEKTWTETGTPEKQVTLDRERGWITTLKFHANGQPRVETTKDAEGPNAGEHRRWHENGQLRETRMWKQDGPYLRFYADGSPEFEAETVNDRPRYHAYWDSDGQQLLKNGTGTLVLVGGWFDKDERQVIQFQNYERNGTTKTFTGEGQLKDSSEWLAGERHGPDRRYYDNGRIEKETTYIHGKKGEVREFLKFDNPVAQLEIVAPMSEEALTNRDLPLVDEFPELLNAKEIAASLEIDPELLDGYPMDQVVKTSHWVAVDDEGVPTQVDFLVAANGYMLDEIGASIRALRFRAAQRRGEPVASHTVVTHRFSWREG